MVTELHICKISIKEVLMLVALEFYFIQPKDWVEYNQLLDQT